MLRASAIVLLGLLGTSVNAESFARDAQTLISNLGYKIVVDGAWGRNSNATLAKLYSDYGSIYDGHLDEEEMAFLAELTANAPGYVHPRTNQVDYSIKYEFPEGDFPTYSLDEYRAKFIETYGQKYFRKDQIDYSFGPACMELYHYYDIYKNINITDGPPTRQFNLTMPTYLCFAEMGDAVDQDFIVNGRDSEPLRIFFEDLVPAWIENDAFSAEGMTSRHNGNDTRPVFTVTQIVSIYTMYAKWWGVSAEMDERFRIWFDKNTVHNPSGFNRADFGRCKEFAGPGPGNNDGHLGWCMNEGANFSVALAFMGRYYKNSDYINEAIYTATMIAKTSSPDAIHLDHVRGGLGLGYAHMTLHRLNDIAMLLDDVGVNFYDMQVATHGRTLRDMINVFAHEALFPDLTFQYSCNDEEMFIREHKVYCHRQDYSSDSLKMALITWLRSLAGPLINNPEFQPFIEITEPWPEIAEADGITGRQNVGFDHWMQFNEYIVIKYFPPLNQFYLSDPNADSRPNLRGDMSADEWIETTTKSLRQMRFEARLRGD